MNYRENGPEYHKIDLAALVNRASTRDQNIAAVEHCKAECTRIQNSRSLREGDCIGFFYQKQENDNEICGFYVSG